MTNAELLTLEERAQLPCIISRRNKFKKMVKTSLVNYRVLFSNSLMISGKPGSGKTTLITNYLDQLKNEGVIAGYTRAAGHITPRSLYGLLSETSEPNEDGKVSVLVLDDVDCLKDQGCVELLKAACDTKASTPTNRHVYYLSENGRGFTYKGFVIIITNDDFSEPENVGIHQQALLDRVQLMSVDMKKEDMNVYITYLVEKMLKENNENLADDEIQNVVDLYNTDIRRWMKYDAFRKSKINFSTRLVLKFVECQRMYGEDWKEFSTFYQRLNTVANQAEYAEESVEEPAPAPAPVTGEPAKNEKGQYINPKTGMPYAAARQYALRKKFAA